MGGSLSTLKSFELAAVAFAGALEASGTDPFCVEEVIAGSCRQAGNGSNPGRTAALLAGVPADIPATTINMACPSGMKCLFLAADRIAWQRGIEVAVDNEKMIDGPAVYVPRALKKANLRLSDIDLLEINEAFAAQFLANERDLGWDRDRVIVSGGAIALGHPTGSTGARIVVTLAHALARLDKELGLASLCGAGGVSTAIVIRRES